MGKTKQVTQPAILDPQKFIYWLQGFAEVHGEVPTKAQGDMIKEHLLMCFDHVETVREVDVNVKPFKPAPFFEEDDPISYHDKVRTQPIMVC